MSAEATASHDTMNHDDFQRLLKAGLAVGASVLTLALAWAQFGGEPATADASSPPVAAPVRPPATPFAFPAAVEPGPAEPIRQQRERLPADSVAAPVGPTAAKPDAADKPAGEAAPADTRTPEEQLSQPGGSC